MKHKLINLIIQIVQLVIVGTHYGAFFGSIIFT